MQYIRERIESELKSAQREVEKIEREMTRLTGRLEEYKDRVVMLKDILNGIDYEIEQAEKKSQLAIPKTEGA